MYDRRTVYEDYAATTPLDTIVLDGMMPFFRHEFGNAASQHVMGRRASAAVEEARANVAILVGAEPEDIVITSGATESISLALKGVLSTAPTDRRHLIAATSEHKAVLDTASALKASGSRTTALPVDTRGLIHIEDLEAVLPPATSLVTILADNTETGTIGPINGAAAVDVCTAFYSTRTQQQAAERLSTADPTPGPP